MTAGCDVSRLGRFERMLSGFFTTLYGMDSFRTRGEPNPQKVAVDALSRDLGKMIESGYVPVGTEIVTEEDRIALELGRVLIAREESKGVTHDDVVAWVAAAKGAQDAIVRKRDARLEGLARNVEFVLRQRRADTGELVSAGVGGVADVVENKLPRGS